MTTLQGPNQAPQDTEITSLVIFLHGYGADGNDLIGLAPFFQSHLPNTAFHAPDGPETCEMSPFGKQWFSLARCDPDFLRRNDATQDIAFEAMYDGACEAAIKIQTYIESLMDHYKLKAKDVALVGFSQGTMMALHLGVRHSEEFAAIVGFSGALVGANQLKSEKQSAPPILLIHGDADEMIPITALNLAQSALQSIDIDPVILKRPNLAHSIDQEGATAAALFLKTALQA